MLSCRLFFFFRDLAAATAFFRRRSSFSRERESASSWHRGPKTSCSGDSPCQLTAWGWRVGVVCMTACALILSPSAIKNPAQSSSAISRRALIESAGHPPSISAFTDVWHGLLWFVPGFCQVLVRDFRPARMYFCPPSSTPSDGGR